MNYDHVTKISRDDGLLSEPTIEVNGNDLWCKRMLYNMINAFFAQCSKSWRLAQNDMIHHSSEEVPKCLVARPYNE